MITTTERSPLITTARSMRLTIEAAIADARSRGIQVKSVHLNPQMKELMDKMEGYFITKIGELPVVTNAATPLDRFWLEKAQ